MWKSLCHPVCHTNLWGVMLKKKPQLSRLVWIRSTGMLDELTHSCGFPPGCSVLCEQTNRPTSTAETMQSFCVKRATAAKYVSKHLGFT